MYTIRNPVMDNNNSQSLENDSAAVRELRANGACVSTADVEAKLDEGNIKEAESSLREGLALNFEEARALLGRLEYQRGNVEGALRVFDGIDLQAAIQRLQSSANENSVSSVISSANKKVRSNNNNQSVDSQHAAGLVLEGVYLKAKSLQKLGRFTEAANNCTNVLDAVGRMFPQGIPNVQVEGRLHDTISQAVELLPELWKLAGNYQEAMLAYRRALLHQWNLGSACCARIQKAFATFLLYSGLEAGPPSLGFQTDGAYVPKSNLEEAILILMVLLQKTNQGLIEWDPSVLDHLTYAFSVCSQTLVLSKHLEEIKPGIFHRIDRWNTLALCCCGAGQKKDALNLLRKSLHKHERPNDLTALLLAAKICSEDSQLAAEGVGYAQRAISNAEGVDEHLKSIGLHMLGLCLGKQAKVSSSDFGRSHLQSEALKSLNAAISYEQNNADIIFELGVQFAEHRNMNVALSYAKKYIDLTGGSILKGWRLLALVLSAQQRFSEAQVVTDAALDETAKWEQGSLLRLKAKLEIAQSRPMAAIETYRYLLALAQAQRKSFGPTKIDSQADDDKVNEFEVWHGLASLYSSLSRWKDVEICVKKAREMKHYSAELLHTEGVMHQERGEIQEAISAYSNAILLEPSYVPCSVQMAAILSKMGPSSLPVARTILSDALRIEPTNRKAWHYLGMVYKDDGRIADATDCLQAASMLEELDPVESFRSIF